MFEPSLLPVLVYRDGAAAIDWLVRVFGLEELRRVTNARGAILHAELRWQHGAAMLTSLAADDDGHWLRWHARAVGIEQGLGVQPAVTSTRPTRSNSTRQAADT